LKNKQLKAVCAYTPLGDLSSAFNRHLCGGVGKEGSVEAFEEPVELIPELGENGVIGEFKKIE